MAELLSFGAWLRQMRKALDLTQDELAARIGYQADTIRKIELGIRRPSKQVAELLAGFLSIPAEELPGFMHFARFSAGAQPVFDPPLHPTDEFATKSKAAAGDGDEHNRAGGKLSPSLAILIPGVFAEQLHWDEHTSVEPKIAGGKLVIEAVAPVDIPR